MYGIDAGMTGVQPREERAGRAHERHADPRLQDAVALDDPAERRDRTVGRFSGCVMMPISCRAASRGSARVGVERDAVADVGQDREVADLDGEARVGGAAQQAVELLDLAALALPPHPPPLGRVPLTQAMEQEEAVGTAVAVLVVERLDAGARGLENLGVARQRLGRRIAKVAEHGEVNVRVDVAERLDLEVREKIRHVLGADRASSARSPSCAPTAGTRSSSSRGSRRGGIRWLMIRCRIWMVSSLAGTTVSSATTTSAAPRQPCAYA